MNPPKCEHGHKVILVGGDRIYPHRPDLFEKKFWLCERCDSYVGCHPGTTVSLGRLADPQTRRLKQAAHLAFDPLWQHGGMTRSRAYAWLAKQLGLKPSQCHMGEMSDEDLRRVVEVCKDRSPRK